MIDYCSAAPLFFLRGSAGIWPQDAAFHALAAMGALSKPEN